MDQQRHCRFCFCFPVCEFVYPLCAPLLRSQQNSLKRGRCEKRTPDTDRPGARGAVQSGPELFSIYGPVAFQLALGGEERDRTDVSELLYSGRGLSTHGRKETI